MKIYTKTGDAGDTGLYGGERRSKADLRVAACGELDELQAMLGLVKVVAAGRNGLVSLLTAIQTDCFIISSEVARTETKEGRKDPVLAADRIDWAESRIDHLDAKLPALKNFILQGGSELGARLYVTRAVCRRAERALVALAKKEPIEARLLAYINRLSDLLFVCARFANQEDGIPEEAWVPR